MSYGVKIASSLRMSIISFKIIAELLAMTDGLIFSEMGRDGGSAAIPSHLSPLATCHCKEVRRSNLYLI
jgi:hypothetical protein